MIAADDERNQSRTIHCLFDVELSTRIHSTTRQLIGLNFSEAQVNDKNTSKIGKKSQLEKMAIAMHCKLNEGRPTSRQSFWTDIYTDDTLRYAVI